MEPSLIAYTVKIALVALVTLPALVLAVLFTLRTPGTGGEPSREWAKYAKVAFGLYTMHNVLRMTNDGLDTENFDRPYMSYDPMYLALMALYSVDIPFEHVGAAAVFYSLFHLCRAFEILRPGETPTGPRRRHKWALAAFVWVCLASVTAMCLSISDWAAEVNISYDDYDPEEDVQPMNRGLAGTIIQLALYATHILCAIFVLVDIAKTRKKVLGSPLHKASDVMLTCGILWLVHVVWLVLSLALPLGVSYHGDDWPSILVLMLDLLLDSYQAFVILVLLYVLATTDKYAVSQPREEQEQRAKAPAQAV
ncbi:hypothetical protein LX36DRAFT_657404 [Colletotrichum falcatum]|nr:hypothetical protein LX36DRAFT_657404 [Colletotrichum falcatum]